MNILEFIAASEWPAVTAAGLWWYRGSIGKFLETIRPKKVSALGVEAEFESILDKADALIRTSETKTIGNVASSEEVDHENIQADGDAVSRPTPEPSPAHSEATERVPDATSTASSTAGSSALRQQVQRGHSETSAPEPMSPPMFILMKWQALEEQLHQAVVAIFGSWTAIPSSLPSAGLQIGLTRDEFDGLHELNRLRNQLLHLPADELAAVSWEDAFRFQEIANRITYRVREIVGVYARSPAS